MASLLLVLIIWSLLAVPVALFLGAMMRGPRSPSAPVTDLGVLTTPGAPPMRPGGVDAPRSAPRARSAA